MQAKRALHPDHRSLYTSNLHPPADYVLDAAVATTFSLDFETALSIPVSLALFESEDRDSLLGQPLALLEGAERLAGRLAIYVDAGRIQASGRAKPRLCSLLESTIVEVTAPRDGGAFHPKIWALRYRLKSGSGPMMMRLILASRNMTRDRSWDVALCLDGRITGRRNSANAPLAALLKILPNRLPAKQPDSLRDLTLGIARDLEKTVWDTLPAPFEGVEFATSGVGAGGWSLNRCDRLAVVSPFVDDAALEHLAAACASKPILIGRSEEIATCRESVLDQYSTVSVLDDAAASEDGEELDDTAQRGLHAKIFVAEKGWHTRLTVGSGNATVPALLSHRNVEVFATLTGRTSRVGSIDEMFGEGGLGRLLRPFERAEVVPDAEQRAIERRLDACRDQIRKADLRLYFEPRPLDDGTRLWEMRLQSFDALLLPDLGSLRVWPITFGDAHAVQCLDALRQKIAVALGITPLADATRFLAFEIVDAASGQACLFSRGVVAEGLPADRNAAILRSFVSNRAGFFRYLRLLLSDLENPFVAPKAAQRGRGEGDRDEGGEDDVPLLEEMLRALLADPERLTAIDRLLERLSTSPADEDPVPMEFRVLWQAFQAARVAPEAVHG